MSAAGGMSPNTARRLAAMIVADAEQLQEKAEAHGVTAFLGKAVQRERPNERFLQNTIRNLASANKRADERVMWAAWEAQKQSQQREYMRDGSCRSGKRSRSRSRDRGRDRTPRTRYRAGDTRQRDRAGTKIDSSCSRSRSRGRQPRSRSRSPQWQEVGQGDTDGEGDRQLGERGATRSCSRSTKRGRQERSRSRRLSLSGGKNTQHLDSQNNGPSKNGMNGRQQPSRRHPAAAAAAAPAVDKAYSGATSSGTSGDSATTGSSSDSGQTGGNEAAAPENECSSEFGASHDEQLVQWLASSKTVRGRGSTGPRADLAGPYLEAPSDPQQLLLLEQGVQKGPERPGWMQQELGRVRLAPGAGFLRGLLKAQGIAAPMEADSAKKATSTKQKRKSKEEKKKRRRQSVNSSDSSSDDSRSDGGSRKRSRRKHSSKHKRKKSKHTKHRKQGKEYKK